MDTWKVAWAAGFFQGEGYIGVSTSKTGVKSVQIRISQHYDPTPLQKFVDYFGQGNVLGPYLRDGELKYYQYHKGGIVAEEIAITMLPYLSGRKEKQVREALDIMTKYRESRGGFNKKTRSKNTKTHCPSGHEYAVYGKLNPYGYTICKSCHAESKRKLRKKKREQ
jgi:hypothetical protein